MLGGRVLVVLGRLGLYYAASTQIIGRPEIRAEHDVLELLLLANRPHHSGVGDPPSIGGVPAQAGDNHAHLIGGDGGGDGGLGW